RILRRLDYSDLLAGREVDLFCHPSLIKIRSSFLNGRVPFPGLCDFCAVRHHGPPVTSVTPDTMQILHVEPSYLSHLSCPQCIAAQDRKSLSSPPYNMPPTAFEALLQQLQAE